MRGSIRKRGGSWEWRARNPEGHHVAKAGFPTKREAQDALTKALAAMGEQRFVSPDRLTTGTYLEEVWLPTVEPTLAATTFVNYKSIVKNHLVPRVGDIPIQKLTQAHVIAAYGDLARSGHCRSTKDTPKGLSPKSLRHVHTTLHRALNDAVDWQYIAGNVADGKRVKAPKLNGGPHMSVWTAAQLQTFLAGTNEERLFPLWRFLAMTGVRRGEAMGLRWLDVDLEGNRFSIVQSRSVWGTSAPKTPGSRRSLDLDPETSAILRRWRRGQLEERVKWGEQWTDTGLVFTREDGMGYHPDTVTGVFSRHQDRVNKILMAEATEKGEEPVLLPHLRLHDLRHTHATLLLANGENAKVISERLGHASVAFTLTVYAHVLPGLQKEAACRLAAVIDGQQPGPLIFPPGLPHEKGLQTRSFMVPEIRSGEAAGVFLRAAVWARMREALLYGNAAPVWTGLSGAGERDCECPTFGPPTRWLGSLGNPARVSDASNGGEGPNK